VPEMEILLSLLICGIGEGYLSKLVQEIKNGQSDRKGSGLRRKNTKTEIENNEELLKKICTSNSKKICRNYSILRKQILELKGLEFNSKQMVSAIELRDSEIKDLLRFYKLNIKDFLKFLSKHFPKIVSATKEAAAQKRSRELCFVNVKADCFLLFLIFHSSISTLRNAQIAPPNAKNTSMRTISEKSKFSKLVFKTKVRRGLFKLRIIAKLLVKSRRKQYMLDIKWFKLKIDISKKKLNEKVYFKEETMGHVKDALIKFGGMKRKTGLVQYEHSRIIKAVKSNWEVFHEWVKNIVGLGPKELEEQKKGRGNKRAS
jgi:hypothetical protein